MILEPLGVEIRRRRVAKRGKRRARKRRRERRRRGRRGVEFMGVGGTFGTRNMDTLVEDGEIHHPKD